jgi:glycosyltransferase involved in cell wall biosynthesis
LPSISVIIPTYNRAHLVGETIDCILRQTRPPEEIIVVDDGSTDDTCTEIERFGARVTLLRQENLGPGAARNRGLSQATGTFIQFFDSDDLATLNLLEAKLRAVNAMGVDLAYGPWLPVQIDGANCFHDGVVRQTAAVGDPALSAFLRGWVLFLPNCLIRRETILRFGGYPTVARTAEDLMLLFDMLAGGVRMAFAPEPLVLVRQHPNNQISASPEGAAARARDYLWFACSVRDRLNREALAVTWADRLCWYITYLESAEGLAVFDRAAGEAQSIGAAPVSRLQRQFGYAVRRFRQLNAGLRARLTGSRLPSFYRTAPLSEYHKAGIRQLGYVPINNRDINGSETL